MNTEEITLFIDSLGRPVVGIFVEESNDSTTVKDPVYLQTSITQEGKINLQFVPVLYREILEDSQFPALVEYKNANISEVKNGLSGNIVERYKQLFAIGVSADSSKEEIVENDTPVKIFE